MSGLSSVLVAVAVAAGAYGVLTFLVSYFRYQKWVYEAEAQSEELCTPDAAALLILERNRKRSLGLLRIRMDPPCTLEIRDQVRASIRSTDTAWRMEKGPLWVVLTIDPDHLPVVASRLTQVLQQAGVANGHILMQVPEQTPLALETMLNSEPEDRPLEGWTQAPADWPASTNTPPQPVSPAVDPLTGTLDATRAPRAFRGLLANHRRRNQPLSVLRVDVDHLREYNEGPGGREAGDAVLHQVASVLMAACRETDLVARLEEDEFLICLPEKFPDALQTALRMSQAVKEAHTEIGGEHLRFTVSIGIAGFPEHGETPRTLIPGAGWAREAAARRGRGSCLVFDPSMRPATAHTPDSPQHESRETF